MKLLRFIGNLSIPILLSCEESATRVRLYEPKLEASEDANDIRNVDTLISDIEGKTTGPPIGVYDAVGMDSYDASISQEMDARTSYRWHDAGIQHRAFWSGRCDRIEFVRITCDESTVGMVILIARGAELKPMTEPPIQGTSVLFDPLFQVAQIAGWVGCGDDQLLDVELQVYECH